MKKESNSVKLFEKELKTHIIDPLVKQAVTERKGTHFESDAVFSAKLKENINKGFNLYLEGFEDAIHILEHKNLWIKDEKKLHSLKELLSDPHKLKQVVEQERKTLQEILDLSDHQLLDIFDEAQNSFGHHHYQQATNIFILLIHLNPLVSAFWAGLGACQEKLGDFQEAIFAYLFAAEFDEHSLASYLHAAKCYLMLKQHDEAKNILEKAIKRTEEHSFEHKDKAVEMLRKIA